MANTQMKKNCSKLLAIREIQIKSTMRYHLNPTRIAVIKKRNHDKCWQQCREIRTCVEYKTCPHKYMYINVHGSIVYNNK